MAYTLDAGIKFTAANQITAAQTTPGSSHDSQDLLAAGKNPIFCVQPSAIGTKRTVSLAARGAGAVPTTVTATLYESSDGGTTWNAHAAAYNLIATGIATDAQVDIVAGLLYQVLETALTLGTATSASVDVIVS